jgi:hypothetical protein
MPVRSSLEGKPARLWVASRLTYMNETQDQRESHRESIIIHNTTKNIYTNLCTESFTMMSPIRATSSMVLLCWASQRGNLRVCIFNSGQYIAMGNTQQTEPVKTEDSLVECRVNVRSFITSPGQEMAYLSAASRFCLKARNSSISR